MEACVKARMRANWSSAILVCGKCSKKLGGGFGAAGGTPLAKALRQAAGLKKGRKAAAGVVAVKCLGVCPKRAVTVIDGRNPGEWLIVRAGADVASVSRQLGLTAQA